jgi:deoxyadenosine/deoxycytidine kinase
MSSKKINHVAIAGNIGAGKTTLTEMLSKYFAWQPEYEDVENNPYLIDFYEDMPRWSFNLQIYFLNSRYRQMIDIRKNPKTVIQDRTIYEDAEIFAPNLHKMGLMTTRDFENYRSLYETIISQVQAPDLMIFLKASIPTLVNNIQNRGRDYEDNIRLDYLKRLNEFYDKWIESYNLGKVLVINCDDLNFVENKDDLSFVYDKVQTELHGLF